MFEGNPNGEDEKQDVSRLIRELELELDGLAAGMTRIRTALARIALTTSPWGQQATAAASGASAPGDQWDNSAPDLAAATESFVEPPVVEQDDEDGETESGFSGWGAVADGASWPRMRSVEPEVAPAMPEEIAASSPVIPDIDREAIAGLDEAADVASNMAPSQWDWTPAGGAGTSTAESHEEATENDAPAAAAVERELHTEGADEGIEHGEHEHAEHSLMSSWPDESLWSQNFDWPSMQQPSEQAGGQSEPSGTEVEHAATETSESQEAQAEVNDIVAQFRAELKASGQPFTTESADTTGWREQDSEQTGEDGETGPAMGESDSSLVPDVDSVIEDEEDEAARRDEVSRAVAEIRRQIESGGLESVMREQGLGFGPVEADESDASEPASEKPAFKLASPGSLPDWSHMPMEPSGPPVVVMKDAYGRVELARVYETLNAIECGDGAALLNYTPHSVTVGLPASAKVPSNERLAEAVAGVFGLSSRVESDGVRITVTIGAESKRGSAA